MVGGFEPRGHKRCHAPEPVVDLSILSGESLCQSLNPASLPGSLTVGPKVSTTSAGRHSLEPELRTPANDECPYKAYGQALLPSSLVSGTAALESESGPETFPCEQPAFRRPAPTPPQGSEPVYNGKGSGLNPFPTFEAFCGSRFVPNPTEQAQNIGSTQIERRPLPVCANGLSNYSTAPKSRLHDGCNIPSKTRPLAVHSSDFDFVHAAPSQRFADAGKLAAPAPPTYKAYSRVAAPAANPASSSPLLYRAYRRPENSVVVPSTVPALGIGSFVTSSPTLGNDGSSVSSLTTPTGDESSAVLPPVLPYPIAGLELPSPSAFGGRCLADTFSWRESDRGRSRNICGEQEQVEQDLRKRSS